MVHQGISFDHKSTWQYLHATNSERRYDAQRIMCSVLELTLLECQCKGTERIRNTQLVPVFLANQFKKYFGFHKTKH